MNTTDKAKGLWCPMARKKFWLGHGLGDGALAAASYNRTKDCNCVADLCAMWRWADPAPSQDGNDRTDEVAKRRGYCGLAGRPEVMV